METLTKSELKKRIEEGEISLQADYDKFIKHHRGMLISFLFTIATVLSPAVFCLISANYEIPDKLIAPLICAFVVFYILAAMTYMEHKTLRNDIAKRILTKNAGLNAEIDKLKTQEDAADT